MYQLPADTAALREYVMAGPSGIQHRAANIVVLQITHSNLKRAFPEIRMDRHWTIEDVKDRLRTATGTLPQNMLLSLKDSAGQTKATLNDNDKKLGYYSPEEGDVIHITDLDPHSASAGGWLDDTSLVQKYEMSEEDYSNRKGTVREWKQKVLTEQQLNSSGTPSTASADQALWEEMAAKMKAGDRCEVFPGGRRAWVRFVGPAPALGAGPWVGVEYDEPVGKNDGSVKGKRFFECQPGFGGMVRPDKVTVGDFPTLDDELANLDQDEL